jgi:hypothetical protein
MKNIHVLSTENSSRLSYNENSVLELHRLQWRKGTQNIYITSDEEIKEGDWFITKTNDILKVQKPEKGYEPIGKKIILTTDQDLIKDGVQAIDDDFLEWFVNNPSCEEVEVQKWFDGLDFLEYKIIIPKEELHSMDDEVECNMCGGYMYLLPDNSIYVCTNSECTRCYEEEDEEPKQETLEEVAEKYVNGRCTGGIMERALLSAIDFGAKWQQEQDKNNYEEDMKRAYCNGGNLDYDIMIFTKEGNHILNEWFEQFKKK